MKTMKELELIIGNYKKRVKKPFSQVPKETHSIFKGLNEQEIKITQQLIDLESKKNILEQSENEIKERRKDLEIYKKTISSLPFSPPKKTEELMEFEIEQLISTKDKIKDEFEDEKNKINENYKHELTKAQYDLFKSFNKYFSEQEAKDKKIINFKNEIKGCSDEANKFVEKCLQKDYGTSLSEDLALLPYQIEDGEMIIPHITTHEVEDMADDTILLGIYKSGAYLDTEYVRAWASEYYGEDCNEQDDEIFKFMRDGTYPDEKRELPEIYGEIRKYINNYPISNFFDKAQIDQMKQSSTKIKEMKSSLNDYREKKKEDMRQEFILKNKIPKSLQDF